MKDLYLICFTLASLVLLTTALVHFIQLEKTETGCKSEKGENIQVGKFIKDPNTCGVIVCQNKAGDALIHYCQRPISTALCSSKGVSTETAWPQCCYTCVDYMDCGPVLPR